MTRRFRHTFGSQLAMRGESLYKIATLMGNSPEICRRHYAALVPEAMCDTVEFPEHKEEAKTATVVVANKDGADSATNAPSNPPTGTEEGVTKEEETKSLRIAG